MNKVLGIVFKLNIQGQLQRLLFTLDGIFFCYVSPLRWCYLGWGKSGHGKGQDIYKNEHIHPEQALKHTQLNICS